MSLTFEKFVHGCFALNSVLKVLEWWVIITLCSMATWNDGNLVQPHPWTECWLNNTAPPFGKRKWDSKTLCRPRAERGFRGSALIILVVNNCAWRWTWFWKATRMEKRIVSIILKFWNQTLAVWQRCVLHLFQAFSQTLCTLRCTKQCPEAVEGVRWRHTHIAKPYSKSNKRKLLW